MPKRRRDKPSSHEPDREPRAQFAALPWRRNAAGETEVMLITSRETHRWVIPKGWPIKGKSSAKSAAQEAFEEAGVRGKVGKKPVGTPNAEVEAFDGVTCGNGHLTGQKVAAPKQTEAVS